MWSKCSSKIKNKVILEVSLDLKIYFIYNAYLYRMKKVLHLNFYCLFYVQKFQNSIKRTRGYSGHFLRNRISLKDPLLVFARPKLLNLNQEHPSKNWFLWSNPYKIKVMITSLIVILELPNFGHMTTFTI